MSSTGYQSTTLTFWLPQKTKPWISFDQAHLARHLAMVLTSSEEWHLPHLAYHRAKLIPQLIKMKYKCLKTAPIEEVAAASALPDIMDQLLARVPAEGIQQIKVKELRHFLMSIVNLSFHLEGSKTQGLAPGHLVQNLKVKMRHL